MSVRTEQLRTIIRRIEKHKAEKLEKFGSPDVGWSFARWEDWRKFSDKFVDSLVAEFGGNGAVLAGGAGGYRLRVAGVSTTCTSGVDGALCNWATAARRKLAAKNAA